MTSATKRKTNKRRLGVAQGDVASVARAAAESRAPYITQAVEQIAVGSIAPSPLNRPVDENELGSLMQSIEMHGLQSPIMVRPMGKGEYEIVFGERRWRACRKLGMMLISCIVRELDEREAHVLRLLENRERVPLDPFQEASCVASLLDLHNGNFSAAAAEIGANEAWVRRRARLPYLSEKWRAVRDDPNHKYHKLAGSIERLEVLAGLPADEQERLLESDNYQLRWCDSGTALRKVIREWLRRLDARPWSDEFEKTLRKERRCAKCDKRSDCQGDLFAGMAEDEADGEVPAGTVFCLNFDCWEEKIFEWLRWLQVRPEAEPGTVFVSDMHMDDKELRRLAGRLGGEVVNRYSWRLDENIGRDGPEFGPPCSAIVVNGSNIGKAVVVRVRLPEPDKNDHSEKAEKRRKEIAQQNKERELRNREEGVLEEILPELLENAPAPNVENLLRLVLVLEMGMSGFESVAASEDIAATAWASVVEDIGDCGWKIPDADDDRRVFCGWLGLDWDEVKAEMERRLAEDQAEGADDGV